MQLLFITAYLLVGLGLVKLDKLAFRGEHWPGTIYPATRALLVLLAWAACIAWMLAQFLVNLI